MNISLHDDYTMIEMPAYLSPDVVYEIQRNLSSALQGEAREFILNMDKVDNLLSAGLRIITHLHKEIVSKEAKLYIINVNPVVDATLRAANMDKKIPVFRTVADFKSQRERPTDLE